MPGSSAATFPQRDPGLLCIVHLFSASDCKHIKLWATYTERLATLQHLSHLEQETPPMVCGHGGDAAQAPPNTMRAFRAAMDGGVRCLEVSAP